MQTYACLYSSTGDFCLAAKRERGYFFHSGRGGTVSRAGWKLNGGANYALPGGRLSATESVVDGAHREWLEETNAAIRPIETCELRWKNFGAGYFLILPTELSEVAIRIDRTVIPEAEGAVENIRAGVITEYCQVHQIFPDAPADNEIKTVQVWNAASDWGKIEPWKGSDSLGWFYEVLDYLKRELLTL
ncbi:MAG: NUDIX domain-containing protein [Ornithinimicrobium sp.]